MINCLFVILEVGLIEFAAQSILQGAHALQQKGDTEEVDLG